MVQVITGGNVRWRVFHGPTPLDVIRQLGDLVGRPSAPPPWAYHLWLAAQGGTDAVVAEADRLEDAGDSVRCGQRLTVDAPIGSPAVYSLGEDREDIRGWGSLRYEDCR